MPSLNVRVSEKSHEALKELSEAMGQSMQATLDEAIENLRRQRLLEETNAAFSALRADPKAWKEELEERATWESTLLDGVKRK